MLGSLALVVSCGTEPGDASIQGSYSTAYDPPRLVSATVNCDRLVSYAILSLNDRGDFDLSVNIIDDCSRVGGGYTYAEVLTLGHYTRRGSSLTFREDGPGGATFEGSVADAYIDLALPPSVGVAPVDTDLRVGPRQPF